MKPLDPHLQNIADLREFKHVKDQVHEGAFAFMLVLVEIRDLLREIRGTKPPEEGGSKEVN